MKCSFLEISMNLWICKILWKIHNYCHIVVSEETQKVAIIL